jgi:hypothetical protein
VHFEAKMIWPLQQTPEHRALDSNVGLWLFCISTSKNTPTNI